MEKFYLTFGVQYPRVPHPHWPGADGSGWVLIEADSEEKARTLARQAFGLTWSHLTDAKHFDEAQNKRRYYPLGQIGHLSQYHPTDVPLLFGMSDPEFYGQDRFTHLGNRIEGRLKQDNQPDWDAPYDVEYFHDKCLPDGCAMFRQITALDTTVLAFEMDWANPWTCAACGTPLHQ